MPLGDFVREIELAKLQTKISSKQTDTYTTLSTAMAASLGLLALALSSPVYRVTGNLAALAFMGLAALIMWRWERFQVKIRRDFDNIYRNEKIEF